MTDALVIFARYPRLGRVKTRLNPLLTPSQSLRLYTAFLLDTLDRMASLEAERHLFLADCSEEEARSWVRRQQTGGPLRISLQQGSDLGDRMWNAYTEVSPGRRSVVFVGSDSPTLPLAFVQAAFEALRERPVAIGPVDDGGYYLIGLSQPRRQIFYDVEWGSERVLGQTLGRLDPDEYALLPAWRDVDTPEDLAALRQDLRLPGPGYPARTGQVLEEISAQLPAFPSASPPR